MIKCARIYIYKIKIMNINFKYSRELINLLILIQVNKFLNFIFTQKKKKNFDCDKEE